MEADTKERLGRPDDFLGQRSPQPLLIPRTSATSIAAAFLRLCASLATCVIVAGICDVLEARTRWESCRPLTVLRLAPPSPSIPSLSRAATISAHRKNNRVVTCLFGSSLGVGKEAEGVLWSVRGFAAALDESTLLDLAVTMLCGVVGVLARWESCRPLTVLRFVPRLLCASRWPTAAVMSAPFKKDTGAVDCSFMAGARAGDGAEGGLRPVEGQVISRSSAALRFVPRLLRASRWPTAAVMSAPFKQDTGAVDYSFMAGARAGDGAEGGLRLVEGS